MQKILLLICFLFPLSVFSQNIEIKGNIKDTSNSGGLPNALLMALRFSDSSLVAYSRSDARGQLKPVTIKPDTYLVIISHPSFSDRTFLMLAQAKDTAFNFSNIVLPPKSVSLKEVEIIAYRESSYYKGDTLIFTADSFKTRANATVEDLLKKLPGFKVDAEGKITVQGKQVDQVLVDGDEFFGSDPTIATRNLNAAAIANVQVYEKKNDSGQDGADETLKVINLQMKDDAKKGYFGKAYGASDFQNYYESQLLMNRFKGKMKASIFGMAANTPKQGFSGGDAWKYGLSGEERYSYNDETGQWGVNDSRGTGVPRTIKAGIYFNDSWGKKTKINTDYTYNQSNLNRFTEEHVQNFLSDTSFSTAKIQRSEMRNEGHNFNLKLTQKLDSLTELIITPKYKTSKTTSRSFQTDTFYAENGLATRATSIDRNSDNTSTDFNFQIRLQKNFKKKDRSINLSYSPSINVTENNALLRTSFTYSVPVLPDSITSQQRKFNTEKNYQEISATFVEPWTKKFKTEINAFFSENVLGNNRTTFDYDGSNYDFFNPALSNSFQNTRQTVKGSLRFIYDVKKFRIAVGSNVRNVVQENYNRSTGVRLSQEQTIPLPMANFQWRINQGSNLNINYHTNSQLPDLQQMQPVTDNSDPNRLSLGTPSLLPTFNNNLSVNYYMYKGITDVNMWGGGNFGNTYNQFSSFTSFDTLGRAVTQPVNVDGNYFGSFYFGRSFPLFKKWMKMDININASANQNSNYINGQLNRTRNKGFGSELGFSKYKEKYNMRLSGSYQYNVPSSSISDVASQPYYTYNIEGSVSKEFKKGFFVSTDGNYNNNGNRTPGYNLNYFIWNAAIGKMFLKTENLVVSLNAYDLLNQNINNQRQINGNQIVDSKTTVIQRYFLLKVLLKFNNQKSKVEDNDWD